MRRMRTTLVVCFFFATHSHAGSLALPISTSTTVALINIIANDATTPSSPVDVDEEELAKIAASCLTRRDHEKLAGGILRYGMARLFNTILIHEAQKAIGLEELRAVAGFSPPGPWTEYREPTKREIAEAPTVEEYYELREPRSEARSLDSRDFFEWNFPPAIEFLDARFPAIRAIYRRRFEAIRRHRPVAQWRIDRSEVDQMIHEYITIFLRVHTAILRLFDNDECYNIKNQSLKPALPVLTTGNRNSERLFRAARYT